MKQHELNITFHGVGAMPRRRLDPGEEDVWVDERTFLAILDRCQGHSTIHITFDDGNLSDFDVALPALVDRKLSALFFVVVDRIGSGEFLDRHHLRELTDNGMSVGFHGYTHLPWKKMTADRETLEFTHSKERLEDILGHSVTAAACPFGYYDRRSLKRLNEAGYDCVYTSDGGWAEASSWLRPRNSVYKHHDAQIIEELLAQPPGVGLGTSMKRMIKRWR